MQETDPSEWRSLLEKERSNSRLLSCSCFQTPSSGQGFFSVVLTLRFAKYQSRDHLLRGNS